MFRDSCLIILCYNWCYSCIGLSVVFPALAEYVKSSDTTKGNCRKEAFRSHVIFLSPTKGYSDSLYDIYLDNLWHSWGELVQVARHHLREGCVCVSVCMHMCLCLLHKVVFMVYSFIIKHPWCYLFLFQFLPSVLVSLLPN